MSNLAIPTLGFDRKRDAILHLHQQGHGTDVIATEVDSTVRSVKATLCKLKRRPNPRSTPRLSGRLEPCVALSAEALPLLRPHAARRGLSCASLAALIIDTVAVDGLVDAILDDREG